MQAQGNDFVILAALDDEDLPALHSNFIMRLCDRHLGIGCDQLLVLYPHDYADALMKIYNADGSEAANCGNGLRCVGEYLMQRVAKDNVSIALADRDVLAKRTSLGVQVNMGQGVITQEQTQFTDVNIGNLHRVYFKGEGIDAERNIELIDAMDDSNVHIRIIERGVGETLACGSGACAVAIAVWKKQQTNSLLTIHMPGGQVTVSQQDNDVYLEGEVSVVFEGEYLN